MQGYDAWLEAPYQEQAAHEEFMERMYERFEFECVLSGGWEAEDAWDDGTADHDDLVRWFAHTGLSDSEERWFEEWAHDTAQADYDAWRMP